MLKHKVIQNINDCLDLENISHDTNDSMTQTCWSDVKSFINLIKTYLKILNIDASTSTFGNTLDTVKTLNELEKKSLWDELENQTQVNQELILQAFDKVYKFYELWQQHQITTKQKDTNETKANPGRQNSKSREAQIEIQKDVLQHELEFENTDQTMSYDQKILKDSKIPISENQFTQKQYKQMMISNNKESEQYDTDTQSIQFKIQQNHNEKSTQLSLNIETEKSYIPRFKICFNDFISKNNFINDNSTINMQQKDDSTWSSDEESQAFELQYKQLNIQPNTNRQMKNQNTGCNIQIQKEDPLPDMRYSNTGSQSDHLNNSGIHRVIANYSSVSQQIENNNPAQFRDSKIQILNTEQNDQPNPNEHINLQLLLSNTPLQIPEQYFQLSNPKLSAEMQNTQKPVSAEEVDKNNNQQHEEDQYQQQTDVQSPELEKAAEVQNNTIQRHNEIQDPQSVKVEQANQIPQTHCNEPDQHIKLEIDLPHHSQSPEKQPERAIQIPTTQPSPSKNSVQTQAKFSQGLKYAILTLFNKDLEDKTDKQIVAFLYKNLNSQTVQKFWSIVELHSGNGSEYYQRQFMRCVHVSITQELKQQTITYLQSLNKLDQTEKQTMQLAKQIRKVVFKEQDVFLYDIIQIMLDNQSKYQVRKVVE
ncbi:Hypothetical_protein [Hexamita inflata]|uniref:Hypothetical_protein n=1 Tax=Hexamita inflata TaxID=28002 RepID=A0AA86VUL8_9EUKA|nr:Hypothetical protein HINF_LOCUS66513 [Hexamita inflata]